MVMAYNPGQSDTAAGMAMKFWARYLIIREKDSEKVEIFYIINIHWRVVSVMLKIGLKTKNVASGRIARYGILPQAHVYVNRGDCFAKGDLFLRGKWASICRGSTHFNFRGAAR